MKFIYTGLFYLLVPFVLLRLYWRGFKAPEYRKRWKERLAFYPAIKYPKDVIWVHAVSVGEAEAVFPLIKLLQNKYKSADFLVTTTTPTGSKRVQSVLGDSVSHVYLPYDLPCVISRFLKIFQPKIALFMEKEIWPNLYGQCSGGNIPIIIINARLSAQSAEGYKKIPALVKPALSNLAWIATQTKEDRNRFIEIGAVDNRISVEGNLKFDQKIESDLFRQAYELKNQLFVGRFVLIVASTHVGEEAVFVELYSKLKRRIPEILLMIVPRHPERFIAVQTLAENNQLKTRLRSQNDLCPADTDVYLIDTMGELKLFYGTADICFVGGSLVPVGGHNILEPALMNIPIMFGPHMHNFKAIAENMLALDAVIQCENAGAVFVSVMALYNNPEIKVRMVNKSKEFVKDNLGAIERVAGLVDRFLKDRCNWS